MRWEEIETEDHPVTFVECAIIARYGGTVPKDELWAWTFPTFDAAHDCMKRLKPDKYVFKGIQIRLKDEPVNAVWTVELANARSVAMIHSKVFRNFPTVEKLQDTDPDSYFYWIKWAEIEKEALIRACIGIQKYREQKPNEKSVHAPYLIQGPQFLKDVNRPFLLIVSWQEAR